MDHLQTFEQHSSNTGNSFFKQRIGVNFKFENQKDAAKLADIVENCPIRLLADIEFVLFSKFDSTLHSSIATLLRYSDISNYAISADDKARFISKLDCLVTNNFEDAKIALLLSIPVWFMAMDDNQNDVQRLKKQWGEKVSIISGNSIGKLFQKMFIFRLLNPDSFSFEPFSGEYSLTAVDGPVTFTLPLIQIPDDLDIMVKLPLFPFISTAIETTSICNLSCSYCPNSKYERNKMFMQEASFYKIVDSIFEYRPDYRGKISPHFYGEPLLDTRLETFIRYCKQKLPNASIEIYTNGCFLDVDRFLSLKCSGVDFFWISQHEETPPQKLIETLEIIKADYPELYTVNYNHEYLAEYKMNRGGLLDLETLPLPEQQFARCATYRDITIDVKGNFILCCNDYFGRHVFGNINEMSVREIWESPEYCEVRNKLFFGFLPLAICKKCVNIVKTQ